MNDEVFLTSDLARAARALTKVSADIVGRAAGLTIDQVRSFERGQHNLTAEQKHALKSSLERYGALFIPEEGAVGYGVRRRFNRESLMRINNMEGEGGPA